MSRDEAIRDYSRVPQMWSALALYAALTLTLAYPLSVRPGSTILADDPDSHLFMWTLAWNAHALTHQPLAIFDANIFYPERRTLAYSENLLGSGLIASPVLWVTGNPVLAMNFVALLSCVLCGLGAYVLGRRLGLSTSAALLCGVIFAFSPPRFFRITQLHLTSVQWIPFALASLHAYVDGADRRHLRLAMAFVSLQAISSGHGGAFVALAVTLFMAWRVVLGGPAVLKTLVQDLGVRGALLLVPSFLILMPYRTVQNEMGLRRSLVDWAPSPESFLASPTHLHAWLLSRVAPHVNEMASVFLFPGYIPLLLVVAALVCRPRSFVLRSLAKRDYLAAILSIAAFLSLAIATIATVHGPIRLRMGSILLLTARDARRAWIVFGLLAGMRIILARWMPFAGPRRLRELRIALASSRILPDVKTYYVLLTVVCFLLAAGPPIGIWPLVYWVPGFNFIRLPSRFVIPGILGIAVLASFGFERMASYVVPRRKTLAAAIIGALMLVEFAAMPLRAVRYRVRIPAADLWLDSQPKPFVVAEVPVFPSERYQTMYMLHSMAHWQKTVHGYSGMRPRLHDELYAAMRSFPDDLSLRSLAQLGVTYVMVHTDLYPPGQWDEVEARIKTFDSELVLQHVAGAARVYLLRESAGGSR